MTNPIRTFGNTRAIWLGSSALAGCTRVAIFGVVCIVTLELAAPAYALPQGGAIAAGAASIATAPGAMTVNQSAQNAVINWQSFGIGTGEAVTFQQPNGNSVALNRVLGADPSAILGSLSANGKVFLVNPNGILFAPGAQVNVGGLVASTLGISDANFMAGNYKFAGSSGGAILNQGAINADGGYVALLGAQVTNDGVISARLGTVALAAGDAVTLDLVGDGLLNVTVDQGAVKALVKNGGLIRANGGQVVMTANSAGQLIKTAVNNTGVIEAQTIDTRGGTIKLLGDMGNGMVSVDGTLDASAPNGGDGGTIETSAATVNVAATAKVTTVAIKGRTGKWVIDPVDFTIGSGGNISGPTLSALLVTNSVTISTLVPGTDGVLAGTPPLTTRFSSVTGNGDINVNDAISWVATPSPTTLTLNAARDVNINQAVTAVDANFVVCCGRDINVAAAITTTRGSVLLNAGNNVNLFAIGAIRADGAATTTSGAMTTTDGNITICAAEDINLNAALTITRGTSILAQSLNLPSGLVLLAGNGGTGPGVGGGTLIIAPGAPKITATGPQAAVVVNYNPTSYAAPTDYLPFFTLTLGAALTQHMLVFPAGDKIFDGTTVATLSGFKSTATSGLPTGVTLVAGPVAVATFDGAGIAPNVGITFTGYSLGGTNAAQYALAANCCTPGFRTSAAINAALPLSPPPPPPPPVVTPPVVTPPPPPPPPPPPVVTPPVATPPVVTPPVVTPPVTTLPLGTPPDTVVASPSPLALVIPIALFPPLLAPPASPVLTIVGARMPLPPTAAVGPVAPPPVYPRKQDRY